MEVFSHKIYPSIPKITTIQLDNVIHIKPHNQLIHQTQNFSKIFHTQEKKLKIRARHARFTFQYRVLQKHSINSSQKHVSGQLFDSYFFIPDFFNK